MVPSPEKDSAAAGGPDHATLLSMLEDMKRSRAQIKQAHDEWIAALDAIRSPVFMHDKDYRVMRSNRAYAERAGMSVKDVLGKPYFEVFPRHDGPLPHCRKVLQQDTESVDETGREEEDEIRLETGEVFVSRSFAAKDADGAYLYSLHIMEDVTERKRDEETQERLNRTLRTLSEGNQTLIHATDEQQLLRDMCHVIVETGGYLAAWVGYAQHDAQKNISPMAQCGFTEGYLDSLPLSWEDNERGQIPAARVIRSGEMQISQNVRMDPGFEPWREQVAELGIASCLALPLKNAGEVFGNLNIYAAEADAFNQAELKLLLEMSEDLAFGIVAMRIREEQKHHTERLRNSLEETVQAIATMIEMRDPYTDGHQKRVADLAVAIATEMGLPDEQVRGVHLAGVIHDLGKIQVPAEILSKPGRLNAAEFALIKAHPQTGYDVLKDIRFPWPIAQIVLQHHERIDGSGYPQGLKGEGIMLEARILIVADVVEAMASHRPYRPGLGLTAALDEIRSGRGKSYDPDVVAACIRLFEEGRYPLPEFWSKH